MVITLRLKLDIKVLIAVHDSTQRYGNSHVVCDHTVLHAARQRRRFRQNASRTLHSTNYPRRSDERLSWPEPVGDFTVCVFVCQLVAVCPEYARKLPTPSAAGAYDL